MMTEEQFLANLAILLAGWCCLGLLITGTVNDRRARLALIVATVLLAGPPLLRLYLFAVLS